MKVDLKIDGKFQEDRVIIEAKQMTKQVNRLVTYIQKLEDLEHLTAKRGDEVYFLPVKDLVRLVIEAKQLIARLDQESYHLNQRLYQLKELLPSHFLQISQSELINSRKIDHLRLTANGLIEIVMTNGDVTFSSRRYLKLIKEELGL